MTTKHTPGPWRCTPGLSDDAEYSVFDVDGNYLTTDGDKREANARLIAAAPDLLAALEAIQIIAATTAGLEMQAIHGHTWAAIAKARGQA